MALGPRQREQHLGEAGPGGGVRAVQGAGDEGRAEEGGAGVQEVLGPDDYDEELGPDQVEESELGQEEESDLC